MGRYLKVFTVLFLISCYVFGMCQMESFAEEMTELKEVPAYTVEFNDKGLTITSEDQEFLNAIEKIKMKQHNYFSEDDFLEFNASLWQIEGNQLIIPYSIYQSKDVEVDVFYVVSVFAKGYEETNKTEYLDSYKVETQITMNKSGDIVIKSNDEMWIQSVCQSQSTDILNVMCSPSTHHAKISASDLGFENGMIVVSVSTQEKYRILAGNTYYFDIGAAGKYRGYELGELTITHGRSDAAYESLVPVPDYTQTFTQYGFVLTSEDRGFINAIDRIVFCGETNSYFSNSQWSVNGNELFIPCAEFFEQGLELGLYRSTVSAKGYLDSSMLNHLDLDWMNAADVQVFVNEQGDIVITSTDEYWLRQLAENTDDGVISIMHDPHHLQRNMANTDLIFIDNQVLITPETQKKYKMYTGNTYLIKANIVNHRYYYQDLGEVTITNGLAHVPSDAKVKQNEFGQIVISSSDINWLSGIISNKDKTGDWSLELFYTDTERHSFLFFNDEDQTDFVWQNGSLIIEPETLQERGITNKYYYFYLNSYSYDQLYDGVIIDNLGLKETPSDAAITTDSAGNIIITSSDMDWLNGIVSYRSEGEAIAVYDSNGNYYEGFVNNDIFTDLSMSGNSVVITPSAQKLSNLIHGETYEFKIQVPGYRVSSGLKVTITKGVTRVPDDTALLKDENGNLMITSSDQSFLDCINKPGAELYLVQGDELIDITNISMVIEDGKVILPLSEIAESGANDGVYTFYLRSSEYEMVYWRNQVIDAYYFPAPTDISVIVDELTGNILITSSDTDWLKGLVSIRDEYAAVYVYDQSKEYVSWFWNTSDETDLVLRGNSVIISSEAQQRRTLYNGQTYFLNFYNDYYEESGNFEVTIRNGALNPLPDDVTVVLDDSDNLMISSQDKEWLNYLYNGTVQLYSDELNIRWNYGKEQFRLSDQLLISSDFFIENGMGNGDYLVYLNVDGYESGEFSVTLTQALSRAPEDVQIMFSDTDGLVVTSADAKYISSITYLDLRKSENPNDVLFYYDDTQAIREQNRYVVPTEIMKNEGVSSGDYDVFVYSSEFGAIAQVVHLPKEFFEIPDVLRIMGQTRYETSFKIADALKQVSGVDKFDVVILATGEGFADALSGSYLASKKGAPIIMVDPKNNNTSTIKEYLDKNMNPDGLIYILGGTSAVPSFVEEELKGYKIKRLAGETRYDTNLLILEEAGVSDEPLLVCSGKGYADSLSASATGLPILLVDWNLNNKQRSFLEKRGLHDIIILGGTAAVNEIAGTAVSFYGGTKRFAGETRYDTSAAVARYFFKDAEQVVLTYARNYPDGICGGPLAYYLGAPMLLASDSNVSSANSYTTLKGITKGVVLGGPKLISDEAVEMILDTKPVTFD